MKSTKQKSNKFLMSLSFNSWGFLDTSFRKNINNKRLNKYWKCDYRGTNIANRPHYGFSGFKDKFNSIKEAEKFIKGK